MKLKIIDPLGLKSGVQISNVRADYSKDEGVISIKGILSPADSFVMGVLEPEIICNVFDKYGNIALCKEGGNT